MDCTLENVRIQLEGRVQLRIVESRLFQVTIEGAQAADPDVPLLTQFTHSDLSFVRIAVPVCELLSSSLGSVALDVGRLSAADIKVEESLLLARHALEDNSDCDALIGPPECETFPRDARPFDS